MSRVRFPPVTPLYYAEVLGNLEVALNQASPINLEVLLEMLIQYACKCLLLYTPFANLEKGLILS